ncbi:hypothetical protein RIF29_14300 [Crotalaria pallida]|uniref:Uncharacterized protein n=1 Tax=Crotalaria pallida TaxID=3830 RepID=A0AAN9II48_CROPI
MGPIPDDIKHWTVQDLVDSNGLWNWDILWPILPNQSIAAIQATPVPIMELEEDEPLWPSNANGQFTVASAQALTNGWLDTPGNARWHKAMACEFLWLWRNKDIHDDSFSRSPYPWLKILQ